MNAPVLEPTACLLCGATDADRVAVTPPHLAPDRGERFRYVRCRRCGLVYLDTRPGPDSLDRYYGPGYLPHRGPEAWGRWAPLVRRALRAQDRRRVRAALAALGAVRPPRSRDRGRGAGASRPEERGLLALDVGCGTPTFLARLRERTDARCTGIDTSDEGWRGRPDLIRGLDLRAGRPGELDLEPGFDLLTLWHVLEHVRDPVPFLARLRALAASDAALVVEVPDHASLPRRLQGPSWIGYDAPRHAAVYKPETLGRMLERGGWEVVRLRRSGTLDPWVMWWLGRQVGRGRTLEGSLEADFPGFVLGKLLTWPVAALRRWIPLGVMTGVARPARSRDAT